MGVGRTIKKITRPVIKLVDHIVPGGRYLTGSEQAHQSRLHHLAVDEHNNYAAAAQNTINDFSNRLNEAMGRLNSLERQRQQHASQSIQLQGYADQIRSGSQTLEQHRMNLGKEANALFELFENFKNKAPSLESKISEVQKLPIAFDQMFKAVQEKRDSLKGLNEDEAGGEIRKYRSDVENLKKSREEMELNIRKGMDEIVRSHAELGGERNILENRLNSYGQAQNILLQESDRFDKARSSLETVIKNWQNEGSRLENEYNSSRSIATNIHNELNSYTNNAQSHLDSLANMAQFRAGKLQKAASNTGILRGLALAALTFGAGSMLAPAAAGAGGAAAGTAATTSGAAATSATTFGNSLLSSLGTGLKYAAPVLGMAAYTGSMNRARLSRGIEQINLGENLGNYRDDLSNLRNGGITYDKIGLPDLEGLKSHFGMPTVPKVQDLPKLSESLGKVINNRDTEITGLGLPQMTSADGRTYSSEVLYDMDFLKKLKKTSKWLGTPYLRGNNMINRNSGNVAYA